LKHWRLSWSEALNTDLAAETRFFCMRASIFDSICIDLSNGFGMAFFVDLGRSNLTIPFFDGIVTVIFADLVSSGNRELMTVADTPSFVFAPHKDLANSSFFFFCFFEPHNTNYVIFFI